MKKQTTESKSNSITFEYPVVPIKKHPRYNDTRASKITLVTDEYGSHIEVTTHDLSFAYITDWLRERGLKGLTCLHVYCNGQTLGMLYFR
ncbi:hypothetical protein AWB82_06662 [Caballeronia glebae]|uniref:Uncharacterized protein n=1 Tax=Caballeronia glebae TaxID=1777143 RepID=A0A158DEP1_9BURK|nr:hypothetical protein AWB82_06662 [Caballeronia glebae]